MGLYRWLLDLCLPPCCVVCGKVEDGSAIIVRRRFLFWVPIFVLGVVALGLPKGFVLTAWQPH